MCYERHTWNPMKYTAMLKYKGLKTFCTIITQICTILIVRQVGNNGEDGEIFMALGSQVYFMMLIVSRLHSIEQKVSNER